MLLNKTHRLSYLNGTSLDPNFKIAAKSACKAQIYECKVFVNKALNLRICKCLAQLQGIEDHFNLENITLSNVHNFRRLHNTSYVGANCDLNVHTPPHQAGLSRMDGSQEKQSHNWQHSI